MGPSHRRGLWEDIRAKDNLLGTAVVKAARWAGWTVAGGVGLVRGVYHVVHLVSVTDPGLLGEVDPASATATALAVTRPGGGGELWLHLPRWY